MYIVTLCTCIYDHLYIDYSEKDGSAVDPHYAILRLMLPLIPIHQETFITVCKRHSGTALGNSEPILPGSSRISPPLHHNKCPHYVVEGIQRIVLSRSLGAVCVRRDYFAKIRNKEGEENRFRRASATSRLRTLRRRSV